MANMANQINTNQVFERHEFTAEIFKERSITPIPEIMGKAKCTMELYLNSEDKILPKNGEGFIEWIIDYIDETGEETGEDDYAVIGFYFENKTLTEYDGVFSLPKQAIELLRKAKIKVPREFVN